MVVDTCIIPHHKPEFCCNVMEVITGDELRDSDGGPLRLRVHYRNDGGWEKVIDEAQARIFDALSPYEGKSLPDHHSVEMGHNTREEVNVVCYAMNILWDLERFLSLPKYTRKVKP